MNRPGILRALVAGVALVTLPPGGHAATPELPASKTTVRSGNHPDFGRIVIETKGNPAYHMDQDGDHVVLHLSDDVTLGVAPPPPRNVITVKTDGSSVDLMVAHGTTVHPNRMGGSIVLDLLDGPGVAAHGARMRKPLSPLVMALSPELGGRSVAVTPPEPAVRVPVEAQSLRSPTPAAPPAPSIAAPSAMETVQQTSPGRDVLPEIKGPIRLAARRIKLPAGSDGSAFLVPFDSTTGAAAFLSGDTAYIVFDERRPVDTGALQSDPVFKPASVQLLPGGTLIRVPLPSGVSLALTQLPQGWRIAALKIVPKQQPIIATNIDGRLNLAAEQSGEVVSLADPDTGATLLVGTQHRPGQGVATTRRSTEFILRTTIQGVVVEPLSDAIVLKQTPAGFTLTGRPSGLALSPPTSTTDAMMEAAHLTRRLDFSTLPPEALLRRAIKQLAGSAAALPMARGAKHRAAAESLLALGLSAEAESLLQMAAQQDPKEAASADTGAMTAIAALMAGRPEESDALADPRLDGTDEIALWRAIRQAMKDDGSPSAAAVMAATAPLAFQYPKPIREHILPIIAETMIKGGEITTATRLLNQRKDDPKLAYARALMQQAEGNTDQALDQLDGLANGHDQFDRARAAVRAVELRLAANKIDKTKAADALDKLLYAWRGDERDLALRERVADLRGETGAWRAALATLRQAEADFPEKAPSIHQRLKDMFAGMIRDQGEHQASPIDFVATVDENADLALSAGDDETEQQSLADRLLALDLPSRAKPVLEKLLRSAKSDVAKARFGLSLATLDSREGDDAGVRTALDGSEGRDLPPDLTEQRTILRAGSVARLGDAAAATAMLAPLRTPRATEARAQILESASDWTGAEQAWSECAALTLPDSGKLDDGQARTVLRLATATARADDSAGLTDLRMKYGPRIGASPVGDMFRLLTAEPVRTTADIKRSQQEMNLATSLPANLKALQGTTVTR